MEVLNTREYSKFSYLEGNREVNELSKKRVIESFNKQYLICPIIVNENYEIIDGQHRFEAGKELGLPIYYFIVEGYGIEQVHLLNANQKNWTSDDYVTGYINLGKQNYNIYKQFRLEYGLPISQTIEILEGKKSGGDYNNTANFKAGNLKIKDLKHSKYIAESICKIKPFYDGYRRKTFVSAMVTLLNNKVFDIEHFLTKLSKNPTMLQDCVNGKAYLILIEEIYNFRNRNKINLRY